MPVFSSEGQQCGLQRQGVGDSWPVSTHWRRADGSVDTGSLLSQFGDAEAPVTTMPEGADGDGSCERMTVSEYLAWWSAAAERERGCRPVGPLKYLKDWNFVAEHGSRFRAYRLPKFFRDDWLNGYYDANDGKGGPRSDYRFVYCGPRGTWTPVHADVLRSYSWSVNIAGRKRWLLLPPGCTHLVYDADRRCMSSTLRPEDLLKPDRFPGLERAAQFVTEAIQEPGEAIFVPSGWHHMVENIDDCISINHNWFNSHNIHWVVSFLAKGRRNAEASIEDCRELCPTHGEFEELVQRNLAANCGLDYCQLLQVMDRAVDQTAADLSASREGKRRPNPPVPSAPRAGGPQTRAPGARDGALSHLLARQTKHRRMR